MAWNQGGGPWGGGNKGGGDPSSGPQSPWGKGPGRNREDLERMLRDGQNRMKDLLPHGFQSPRLLVGIVAVLVLIWLGTGFYRVNPGEQGVELIFGKYYASTEPGLNWNWPGPIGSVVTPDISTRYRVEVGFRSASGSNSEHDVPEEGLMLTGDENIIDVQFVVLWKIKDVQQYLFDIRDPETSVKNAVEAAMREIIGQNSFELARTQGRGKVESQALELAQKILDSYSAGIAIEQVSMQKVDPPAEVIESFRDVQAARSDKERMVNEAQAYYNQITQEAEGQAAQAVKQAEGYQQEKVAIAAGEAQRFLSIYEQYKADPEVTKRRLYLETMEQVMKNMDKVILDQPAGGSLPLFSINELLKRQPAKPSQEGAGQ